MKRFNLGRTIGQDPSEGGAPPAEGRGPRRIFLVAAVLVILGASAYWVAVNFLLTPPPPSPPSKPIPVQPVVPKSQAPAPMAQAPQEVVKAKPKGEPRTEEQPKSISPPQPEPQKPAQEAAVSAKPAPSITYSLQVGAMVQEQNAQALKKKLAELGYPSRIRKGSIYMTKHVVYVGGYASREEAETLARRLHVDGFPSQVFPLENRFFAEVGAFFSLDEAIDLAHELQKKNYPPKIVSSPINTTVYQVRIGPFGSQAEALKRKEELKAKGFTSFVVKD